MKTSFLKTKIVPLITAIIVAILFTQPVGLGELTVIVATLLIILASFIMYGKGALKSLGLSNFKEHKRDLITYAPLLGFAIFALYIFVLLPGATYLTGQPIDLSEFAMFEGNLPACAALLLFIWISAAFGEEIIYKGFCMKQFERFFGNSTLAVVINIVLFGVIFGYIHAYQGITGQIVAAITGMILGYIFYKKKYNLWFNIAVHGFIDTFAVVCFYNGWI